MWPCSWFVSNWNYFLTKQIFLEFNIETSSISLKIMLKNRYDKVSWKLRKWNTRIPAQLMAAPTEFWNGALKDAGCACKNHAAKTTWYGRTCCNNSNQSQFWKSKVFKYWQNTFHKYYQAEVEKRFAVSSHIQFRLNCLNYNSSWKCLFWIVEFQFIMHFENPLRKLLKRKKFWLALWTEHIK